MTAICRVFHVEDYERQHIDDRAAWWLACRLCPPLEHGSPFDLIGNLFGSETHRRIGWAPTWELAIRFADAHAAIHADKTCPTCAHTPAVQVTIPDTQALMSVRTAR